MGPWQSDPRHVRQGLIAMSDFQEDELLAAWETQSFADGFCWKPYAKWRLNQIAEVYDLWVTFLVFSFQVLTSDLKKSWLRDTLGVVGIATLTHIF